MRVLPIVLVALAALLIVGGIAAAVGSDSKPKTATAAPAVTVPAAVYTVPDTDYTPPTTAAATWAVPLLAAADGWITALGKVSTVASAGDYAGTIQACNDAEVPLTSLRDAAANVTVYSLQTPLEEAIRQYSKGLSACESGDLTAATADILEGNTYLQQATSAAKAYGGG